MKKLLLIIVFFGLALNANADKPWQAFNFVGANSDKRIALCKNLESEVGDYIKQSNYCKTAEDCSGRLAMCPFGDHLSVYKDYEGYVKDAYDAYTKICQPCKYDMRMNMEIICQNNKCIPKENK